MPTIKNVSLSSFLNDSHLESYAIRVVDSMDVLDNIYRIENEKIGRLYGIKDSKNIFEEVAGFSFLDVNKNEDGFISEQQSICIVDFLEQAKKYNKNIVVHCVMGVSRSGAIAQFAIDFLGFSDAGFKSESGYGREHKNADIYNALRKTAGFLHSFEV